MNKTIKLETLINQAIEAGENDSDINYVKGGLGASFVNTIGRSLVVAHATLLRYDDPNDPFFGRNGRMTADQRAERVTNQEQRIDQLADTLAWVAQYASLEVTPTGAELVARSTESRPATRRGPSDEEIAQLAEFHEVEEDDIKTALRAEQASMDERQALTRKAIDGHEASIAQRVDRALEAHIRDDLELSAWDAVSIAERLATKCGEYASRRLASALREHHPKRKSDLFTEAKLLKEVSKAAAKIESEFRNEATNIADRAPIENLAAEVA